MLSTAVLVGVFGTTQSKCVTLGSSLPVIHVQVVPPSSDRRSSASHKFRSMRGNTDIHSTLTTCPGTKTSPAFGEISLALYCLGPASADAVLNNCGAKANVNANSVIMNRAVFIFLLHFTWFILFSL